MNNRMLLYVLSELVAIKQMLDECEGQPKLKSQINSAILEARASIEKPSPPKTVSK